MLQSKIPDRLECDTYSRQLVEMVAATALSDFDEQTISVARIFLADTWAVGVAGRCSPAADSVYAAMAASGETGSFACLGHSGRALPKYQAAVVNGFQTHALEWDGLHEPSVVIALCVSAAALSCEIQRSDATLGDLLLALVTGVETAVFFGAAAANAPRFFRPSAAGVMGAAMAIGKLRGFDETRLINLLGLAYSQAGGTMQAHWEGSEALALQVGFAARAALTAADLVQHGATGPHNVVNGKFGYFQLIEKAGDIARTLETWGQPWKITEVAHKPFPAGRATQAVLTALLDMRAERDFDADEVEFVSASVPSLIQLLVNRPYIPDMSPAYARLCLQYVVSRMLLDRKVDPQRFNDDWFRQPEVTELAPRIACELDDNPDPNALGPQVVTVKLRDGRQLVQHVSAPLGAPGRRLDADMRIAKVRSCFEAAGWPGDAAAFLENCEGAPLDAPAIAFLQPLLEPGR